MQKLFLFFFSFSLSLLCGTIIETDHFADLTQYITPNTLVLVDIDDTLLIPVQTLEWAGGVIPSWDLIHIGLQERQCLT